MESRPMAERIALVGVDETSAWRELTPGEVSAMLLEPLGSGPAISLGEDVPEALTSMAERLLMKDATPRSSPLFYRVEAALTRS